MNIDEMPAGPEMDMAIATEVMGYVRRHLKFPDGELIPTWNYSDVVVDIRPGAVNYIGRPVDDFKPSTDIAHAWEVVDKIGSRFAISIHAGLLPPGHPPYAAMVSGIKAYAETAPLALCRAVLKAVRS